MRPGVGAIWDLPRIQAHFSRILIPKTSMLVMDSQAGESKTWTLLGIVTNGSTRFSLGLQAKLPNAQWDRLTASSHTRGDHAGGT